jgi:transposase
MRPTIIGLDIAKSVFQVHGVDNKGKVVIQKQLKRVEVFAFFKKLRRCLIGIEACSTSNYWARELRAIGHDVKLLPAQYVKPYVKRSKTDAKDAEAICEAVTRPTMRFVPIKTAEEQALGLLHQTRSQLISQRVVLMGSLRSGLAELGLIASTRRGGDSALLELATSGDDLIPEPVRATYVSLAEAIRACKLQVAAIDRKIAEISMRDDTCARLQTIPSVGPVTASVIVAVAGEISRFPSGRHFAAWLGLTPRLKSSGGAVRMGRISKAGNKTLRSLLVVGALTVIRRAKTNPKKYPWLASLLERRPPLVAAVAYANKVARTIWAILARGGTYRVASVT